jgi:hypothetical protein
VKKKIQISKSESHEINIPESLTSSEFLMLTSRFQQLARIFSKDPAIDSSLIGGTKKKKLLGVGKGNAGGNSAARKILKTIETF